MNKKLLICAAIATGLLLTACVKKEAPKEEDQTDVASSEPVNLQPLEQPSVETTLPEQESIQIERIETENTTTEIRRSVQETESTQASETANDTPATPKVEDKPTQPKANHTSGSQSEDDAVAAAIAAATPALEN